MERAGVDSAKRIVELEAQRDQLKEENVKLRAREVRLKERFDSEESKWREEEDEIRAKCWLAESEKRKLQIDLKVAVGRVADGGISDKLKAAEAEAARLDISLKDSRSRLVSEFKRAMEAEKQVLELLQKIEVLEKANNKQELVERTQSIKFLEDELCEANKNKTEEIKRILNEKMDVEAEKRSMEDESGKKVSEMARRIEVLSMEKRSMTEEISILKHAQAKYEKTNSELVSRVEVLERHKRGLEMETRKKDQEIKLLVQKQNDSSAANKKILEMETNSNRCTVPIPQQVHPVAHNQGFAMKGGKQEAGAMPAYSKLSVKKGGRIAGKDPHRPKKSPSAFFIFMEDFRKTFKEKNPNNKSVAAVGKAGGAEWKTMNVADKAPYVEKAVQRKKEYEKSMIAYRKLVKTHCGVDSDNIRRVEGGGTKEEESDKSGSEVHDDDDDDEEGSDEEDDDLQLSGDKRRVSGSENQRRKVEALGCTVASQAGTKRSKQELVWTTPEKMLNAFTANDELCMRSVCALYRKHKSLGPWKNRSTSSIGNHGFMPPYEARGMVLGELLTSRDPEGRLKKSLAEFERADSRGPADCMQIARQHYKELFEMYRNNLDPLYRPGDDMN